MDQYGAASQQKAAAALDAGKFTDEIIACTVMAGVADPVMGPPTTARTIKDDEASPPGTTYYGPNELASALPGALVLAP